MFAFELGREFRLSIAEIFKVFSPENTIFCDKKILIIDWISKEEILKKGKNLGWSIKIIEIIWVENQEEVFSEQIEKIFSEKLDIDWYIGKFNYAVNIFWHSPIHLKDFLKISKKVIKNFWLNPRFINQDFKNLASVVIIKEALIKKETDFNFIYVDSKLYFWKTIFVQDIYGYSNRDYGKDRDMHVWMLPPKLAQMMINISGWKTIYDPFVWLGTVLIESVYMWNTKVFWSDISNRMVETTFSNLWNLKNKFNFEQVIMLQNAKYIHEVHFLDEIDAIVTEWYLWEIMTQNNISVERIEKQKQKLSDLYEWFFSGLQKKDYKWSIVISFPFWEIKWKFLYFEEIYDIINKYCIVQELLPKNIEFSETKSGSLLYKRDSQLVGREIFYLKLK